MAQVVRVKIIVDVIKEENVTLERGVATSIAAQFVVNLGTVLTSAVVEMNLMIKIVISVTDQIGIEVEITTREQDQTVITTRIIQKLKESNINPRIGIYL